MATIAGFDWDMGNRAKCQKHGVSIEEIEEVFAGVVMILPDAAHSTEREERQLAIGRTKSKPPCIGRVHCSRA
jgi:uncharacterized protein